MGKGGAGGTQLPAVFTGPWSGEGGPVSVGASEELDGRGANAQEGGGQEGGGQGGGEWGREGLGMDPTASRFTGPWSGQGALPHRKIGGREELCRFREAEAGRGRTRDGDSQARARATDGAAGAGLYSVETAAM